MTGFHLAQVNVARLAAPFDSLQLAGFVANLEPINAIADASPGFVWRLQTEAGTLPTLRDAEERLLRLHAEGPTSDAFTLKVPYPVRRPAPAP